MRVLHVTSGNLYGGVETFLTTLRREAAAAPAMASEFAVCFDGRFSRELAELGANPHRLPSPRLSRPHTVVRARRALADLLQRESFDVVLCHQPWACVIFASVIRAAGLPVVLWVHVAGDGRHWLERLCRLTRPNVAICNSRFTAERTSSWLPHSTIEHEYCPVSTSAGFREATDRLRIRRSLHTQSDDVVVVQVSRLEPFKGQHILLSALASLRDVPGWTCWIVGGAQRPDERRYLDSLEAITRTNGIADRVRFIGESDAVGDLLRAADVYCQPNLAPEGFGLTFIEAMRAGLPVVTTGIGGAREIVTDDCGTLTQPGDTDGLAGQLHRLFLDADLRAGLGREAHRRSDDLCHPSRQMRRIESLLAGFAAGPRVDSIQTVGAK